MPDNLYPAFEDGQTLTAHDLNQLREFLHGRDRLLGRLTGFGVNCGLGGSVSGTTLTIAPGLAVDQVGEPMLLAAAQTIPLPPTVSAGQPFAFIAPGAGFSVVLESTDTFQTAPDCGETDCEGHAEEHTRAVALRVVSGRITGPWFDFANEALLTVQPMLLSLMSAPQGNYGTLKTAIADRLTNPGGSPLIDPALITRLRGTSLAAGDLPGVKGYKAGFINQVLFATLDLLRCRALMAPSCDRTTPRPGVVLGWVRLAGTTWQWDCGYRHAWEPPRGLVEAFIGGDCADPCGLYRDELEGLIAGYAPPDPPTTTGPGPVVVVCPHGMVMVNGRCLRVQYPPKTIDPNWTKVWIKDPRGPRWNPPTDIRERLDEIVVDIYAAEPLTFFGTGVINALDTLGWGREVVTATLTDTITELGGTAHIVMVHTEQELTRDAAGYEPGASFNLGDTIVLTVDTADRVVALGRVPGAHIAREMGTALPAATAKATEALAATEIQQGELATITTQVGGLREELDGFKGFEQTTTQWRVEVVQELAGVGATVEQQVKERVGVKLDNVLDRVSRVEGSLDVITKIGIKGGAVAGQRLDQDFARGMVEFAETVNAGLGSLVTDDNQKTLGRYVGEATRAAATLEVVAAGGDPIAIGDAAVTLMGTLRTAVKSTGIDAALGRQLDAQLNAVKGMLG